MSVLPVNTQFCSRVGEFLTLRYINQQALYFPTEIYVQSSAGAQRDLISEFSAMDLAAGRRGQQPLHTRRTPQE